MQQLQDRRRKFDDHRAQYHADHGHQFDENVERGGGGVLAEISDGIADLMASEPLPPCAPFPMNFLALSHAPPVL